MGLGYLGGREKKLGGPNGKGDRWKVMKAKGSTYRTCADFWTKWRKETYASDGATIGATMESMQEGIAAGKFRKGVESQRTTNWAQETSQLGA